MCKSRLGGVIVAATCILAGCGGGNENASTNAAKTQLAMRGAQSATVGEVALPAPRDHYSIQATSSGYLIKNIKTGVTTLTTATRIHFADTSIALDLEQASRIYRLYQAAFNRQPDLAGLGYWLAVIDAGTPLQDVAANFMQSKEFHQLFGEHPTDQEFLTALYNNVLHRNPDIEGLAYWIGVLKAATPRAQVLIDFSESAENVAQVAPAVKDGINYAKFGVAYKPVARAGSDQETSVGKTVTIDGTDSSDANGDALNYVWLLNNPPGSAATSTTTAKGQLVFAPDIAGTYSATLTVNDGVLFSEPYIVTILATSSTVPPIADTGRYACSTITHTSAIELYNQGHQYLDRDHDGKPCEASDIAIEKVSSTPAGPTTPTTGMCYVNGYYRKNGTYVKGYWRRC